MRRHSRIVVNNPWECFQPNSKVEEQEGSSGGRNGSRLPLSILAKNAFSFKLFGSSDLKSSVRFLLSALMAIRPSMELRPHLSSYMSINDFSLWYNTSKEKIERLNFRDWRSLHLKSEDLIKVKLTLTTFHWLVKIKLAIKWKLHF